MTIAQRVGVLLVVLAAAFGLSGNATAQTNDEIFPQFQWNFSTPGARANGMGRTFIGMADDATASVTNPAGLISLTRPQVYLEYKNTDIKVDRLAAIDSLATLNPTTFSTKVNALSFFNVSSPVGNKIAVGFSYHQFLNYQETFHLSPRAVHDVTTNVPTNFATFGVQGYADFTGSSYAGSVSLAVTDQVRVGFTVSDNHLKAKSTGTRFDTNFGPNFTKNGVTIINPNDLSETPTIVNQTSIDDSNDAIGYAFGVLARPNENFLIGFDYTKGPSFKINERFLRNPGRILGQNQTLVPIATFADPTALSIHVPTRFGAGIAVRPTPKLLVALDIVRINYSSLAKDFVLTLDFSSALSPTQFSVADATEVHFGGEYNVVTGSNPVFVRAGFYTNPNHTVKFATAANTAGDLNNYYNSVYNLLPRDTEKKGTVGAGVAVGPRLQLDFAYVWKKEFVASTAVRF